MHQLTLGMEVFYERQGRCMENTSIYPDLLDKNCHLPALFYCSVVEELLNLLVQVLESSFSGMDDDKNVLWVFFLVLLFIFLFYYFGF